jgi:hypothetical protein
LFEILEYKFKIKSQVKSERLQVKSINLFYNNSDRNKAYFDGNFSVVEGAELELSYKLLIKESDKNLKLKSVRFEILTPQENSIYFEMDIKSDKEKIVNLKNLTSNILEFDYKKNIDIGLEQYYNFDCELIKKDPVVQVDHILLKFFLTDEGDPTKSMSSHSSILK